MGCHAMHKEKIKEVGVSFFPLFVQTNQALAYSLHDILKSGGFPIDRDWRIHFIILWRLFWVCLWSYDLADVFF